MGKTRGLRKYRRKSKRVKMHTKPFSKKSRKRATKHKKNKRRLGVKNRRTRRIIGGGLQEELEKELKSRGIQVPKSSILETYSQSDRNLPEEKKERIQELKKMINSPDISTQERSAFTRELNILEADLMAP